MKRTPWFPGSVKPIRVGVYQRRYKGAVFFCKWTGRYWKYATASIDSADGHKEVSPWQCLPWRGLTEKAK